jgi:hypothetical protein
VYGQFGASIPNDPKDIQNMLQYRQPTVAPKNAVPIDQLAAQVAQEVGSVNAEGQPMDEEVALANTSYTLVRSELDRVRKTPA